MFDIVPSDAPESVLSAYPVQIPVKQLSPDETWARLDAAVREYCPFSWSLHLPIQVNRHEGAWIIALYNPWGAKRNKGFGSGSELDQGCSMLERLKFKAPVKAMEVLYRWPDVSNAVLDEATVNATIAPGGLIILRVTQ
jgi:hypothetical protein